MAMGHKYNLNLYSIRLPKRYDPKTQYILSDFGANQDLLDITEDMFNSWKLKNAKKENGLASQADTEANSEKSGIVKVEDKKVVRIKQNEDETFQLKRVGRILDGIVMYGEAGTSEQVVNVNNGAFLYTKSKDDAPLKPFFFKIYIPTNSSVGFLIIESIGTFGISTIIQNELIKYYSQKESDAILRIQPIGITELADSAMEKSQGVKRITLRKISNSNFNVLKLVGDGISNKDFVIDYVIKATGNRFSSGLFSKLCSSKNKETSFYEIDGNNISDIIVTMDIDGHERSLSVQQFTKLGSSIDVTNKVVIGDDGYPTFDSLNKQAMTLIALLQKQYDLK